MRRQSPGSCCWERQGCETHRSESGAAASLPASWAGPWGEDSPGTKVKSGPLVREVLRWSSLSRGSSFSLLFGSAGQGGRRVTCSCLRERELPAAGCLPRHSTPAASADVNTHANIWYLGGRARCRSPCQPGSGARLPEATGGEARGLAGGLGVALDPFRAN